MHQLKLSQIPKKGKFIFNENEFEVLEIRPDGVMVRRLNDNHIFVLPGNTEVEEWKEI